MFLAHYILPFIIYHARKVKDKVMLYGLLIGNFTDLDHILLRIKGDIPWFESACPGGLGTQCSFGTYPMHSLGFFMLMVIFAIFTYKGMRQKKKNHRWLFWISTGVALNLVLDYIHLTTGFSI